jgi:transposase
LGTQDISCAKKKARAANGIILFEDEAAFRQDPTTFRSWYRRGARCWVSTYGRRNTQHIYGAVSVPDGRFSYHFAHTCNASTHQGFLEMLIRKFHHQRIFIVEDNAKYHKNPAMLSWFEAHRHEIEPWFLPPYSPEFNPMEPVWGYTRRQGTHNRFFASSEELLSSIKIVFRHVQHNPDAIRSYLEAVA